MDKVYKELEKKVKELAKTNSWFDYPHNEKIELPKFTITDLKTGEVIECPVDLPL